MRAQVSATSEMHCLRLAQPLAANSRAHIHADHPLAKTADFDETVLSRAIFGMGREPQVVRQRADHRQVRCKVGSLRPVAEHNS